MLSFGDLKTTSPFPSREVETFCELELILKTL